MDCNICVLNFNKTLTIDGVNFEQLTITNQCTLAIMKKTKHMTGCSLQAHMLLQKAVLVPFHEHLCIRGSIGTRTRILMYMVKHLYCACVHFDRNIPWHVYSADSSRASCQLLTKEWALNTGKLHPRSLP